MRVFRSGDSPPGAESQNGVYVDISNADRAGVLFKWPSRSVFPLSDRRWKRRFCIQSAGKLYCYHKEIKSGYEKPSRVISLDHYNNCDEVNDAAGNLKKRKYTFLLTCNDQSCGGKDKLYFSTETQEDMWRWVSKIRESVTQPKTTKKQKEKLCESCNRNSLTEAPQTWLYNATKYRARGPQGRRPPNRRTMQPSLSSGHLLDNHVSGVAGKPRSSSTSDMDPFRIDPIDWSLPRQPLFPHTEEKETPEEPETLDEDAKNKVSVRNSLRAAYRYSSSEDDSDDEKPPKNDTKTDHHIISQIEPHQSPLITKKPMQNGTHKPDSEDNSTSWRKAVTFLSTSVKELKSKVIETRCQLQKKLVDNQENESDNDQSFPDWSCVKTILEEERQSLEHNPNVAQQLQDDLSLIGVDVDFLTQQLVSFKAFVEFLQMAAKVPNSQK